MNAKPIRNKLTYLKNFKSLVTDPLQMPFGVLKLKRKTCSLNYSIANYLGEPFVTFGKSGLKQQVYNRPHEKNKSVHLIFGTFKILSMLLLITRFNLI